jgi:hypothetical protein
VKNHDFTPKNHIFSNFRGARAGCAPLLDPPLVRVSVLDSSVVDWVKPKAIKLVFVASVLSTQHLEERVKTGWLGNRIMCPSGVTCLPTDCCFSELAL